MMFSVIIPLEFNRGLAVRCVRAWVSGQTYDRSNYEILVAAAENHPPESLEEIRNLLLPCDRLLLFPVVHDIGLSAAAVADAKGKVFVFTEAHCLPEGDFLEQADRVCAEHPEWGGFSGGSRPLTHNGLSEIEAEMYVEDIDANLSRHEWLKVLDQCFVIRRMDYIASGGIEPEYGHFAEWLFAARLYAKGSRIGHAPDVRIQHVYSGNLRELEVFTIDFTRGEMAYASVSSWDPCGHLLGTVPEWTYRSLWNGRLIARYEGVLRLQALSPENLDVNSIWGRWVRSLCARFRSLRLAVLLIQGRRVVLASLLRCFLGIHCKRASRRLFKRWMEAVIRLERLRFVGDWYEKAQDSGPNVQPGGVWTPALSDRFDGIGIHHREIYGNEPFRWFAPEGCLELPMLSGSWSLSLFLAPILPHDMGHPVRWFLNGRPLSPGAFNRSEIQIELEVDSDSGGAIILSWIAPRFKAPDDTRELALPVTGIRWMRKGVSPGYEYSPVHPEGESIYLLHVPKCAGTTSCALLENHFRASDCLFPDWTVYYARQLKLYQDALWPAPFAVGHFGWRLPAAKPDIPWKIVTLMRHPGERLLSLFGYHLQTGWIPPDCQFEDWLATDLTTQHLMTFYFIPHEAGEGVRGMEKLRTLLDSYLEEAIRNLQQCAVVGLQEEMEDTVSLLCTATGCYPPWQAGQFNPTDERDRWEQCSDDIRSRIETALKSECLLYREAVRLFRQQRDAMVTQACISEGRALNTKELRGVLRKRYFQRASGQLTAEFGARVVAWTADAAHIGDNLHKRECHSGRSLRWTGTKVDTLLYLPVGMTPRPGIAVLVLHPASPRDHVQGLMLRLNDEHIRLKLEMRNGDYHLTGSFMGRPNPDESGCFARLEITAPVGRVKHDFRDLGVALQRIMLSFE